MKTETQPSIIRSGRIGQGGEYDVLGGSRQLGILVEAADKFAGRWVYMPALSATLEGRDGTQYSGPLFSLS